MWIMPPASKRCTWHVLTAGLPEERGRLVPFRDSDAIAEGVVELLTNETERHAMRKRAFLMGRSMTWPNVAREYVEVFDQVRETRSRTPRRLAVEDAAQERFETLPGLNAKHLLTLTDCVGILQHARFSVPDPQHGYSTDDQARALIVAVKAASLRAAPVVARRDAAVGVGAGVDEAALQGIFRIADRPREPNQQADRRAMFNTSDCPLLYLEGGRCVAMQATNAGTDTGYGLLGGQM